MLAQLTDVRNDVIFIITDPDPALMTALDLGKMDAEDGMLCLPELYFVKPQDLYDYAIGFASIKPGDLLAEQIMSRFEAEKYAEAQAERDELYDREYAWAV